MMGICAGVEDGDPEWEETVYIRKGEAVSDSFSAITMLLKQ